MNLSERFSQLNAPQSFSPYLGIPFRWRLENAPRNLLVMFDPDAETGFALRVHGEGIDIAFHLDGHIARTLIDKKAVINEQDQEDVLNSLLVSVAA